MTSIPVVDIGQVGRSREAASVAAIDMASACVEVGFFYLGGHGVDARVVAALQSAVERLFALPDATKRSLSIRPGDYRGYIPFNAFGDNSNAEGVDHYEGYKLHREVSADDPIRRQCTLYAPNRWPARVAGFKQAVLDYWREMECLSETLLTLFAQALEVEPDRMLSSFEESLSNMTLLHYPETPVRVIGSGIHPHRDIDAFTILYPGEVSGLEIRTTAGSWLSVEPRGDRLIVNIGNMMELWSGGRFVSTPHRVSNPVGRHRYSFPYFAIPRHDVLLEPLVPRVPGFTKPPVRASVAASELYRTNWKSETQTDPSADVGAVDLAGFADDI